MEYDEVVNVAATFKETLSREFEARMRVLGATERAEQVRVRVLILAVEADLITGKNEKTRELERAAILSASGEYQAARGELAIRQAEADIKAIARKHAEALVGLTKAWLYSQSGNR